MGLVYKQRVRTHLLMDLFPNPYRCSSSTDQLFYHKFNLRFERCMRVCPESGSSQNAKTLLSTSMQMEFGFEW